ncbi:MAG TPA: alpha/beta hydrolase [Methanocorpusculum sp.]|nr:alpha/beta hydrolase [Methanocorpusculum sp.]HJK79412.1 alpha/beta hydrolase [Methanocorpusculum sp.]
MEKTIRIPFSGNNPILIRGRSSFLLAACVREKFPLIIETDTEELVQGIYPGDLIIISAPEGGEIAPALYLLEMVKTYHTPVIALGKDHPASRRLSYVVSAAERIEMRCGIRRGTHPDQHLLCAADEFTGMILYADGAELVIEHCRGEITAAVLAWNLSLTEEKMG